LETKVKLYLNHTPSPPGEGWGEVKERVGVRSGEGWGEVRRGFFTHGYSHLIPSGSRDVIG